MKRIYKIMIKYVTAGAAAILLCVLAVMPAFSMGFHAVAGALSYGTAPLNAHSMLQVESLQVSVDIPTAPDDLYGNEQKIWENYTVVTSKYSLYNASEQSVTETMAIPFGAVPDYTYDEDDTSPVLPYPGAYQITFKGQSITSAVRHSLSENSQRNDQFEELDDSAWSTVYPMQDIKMTDRIYYPEQKVTVYTYKVSNPDAIEGNDFKLVSQSLERVDQTATRVYITGGGESEGRLLGYADADGETFEVFVIGKDIGELNWRAVTWGDEKSIDSVTVSLQGISKITFGELAMQYYTPDCGASEVDWYNAVYCYFSCNAVRNGIVDAFQPFSHDITDYLQGWLIYEITLEPHERAELVTQTPAFPDIINWYEPYVYEYGYDLVGLSRFQSVGTVEFSVNTPCYTMENSSYYYVHQVPAGEYSLTLDKVDRNAIVFSICEKQKPLDVLSGTVYGILGAVLLGGLVLLVLSGVALVAVILVIFAVKKKIKRKDVSKNKESVQAQKKEGEGRNEKE
ncbi:MAG: hypothetical protein IJW70_10480 [Clostridia bacterium]|nr:hypothetical protein [Clostridia bacterium]